MEDKYGHLRCVTCGVPWFDYGPLRWPLHSSKCANHVHKPKFPHPLAPEKEAIANLPRSLRPQPLNNGAIHRDIKQAV